MILLIDNYDSFTYNLYQAIASEGPEVRVLRNDAASAEELLAMSPTALVLSPGPGRPAEAGVLPELLEQVPEDLPVLGICLGHQALVESLGGELAYDEQPVHGKSSLMHHDGRGVFQGLPNPFPVGRYHSLYARRDALPDELELSAWTEDGKPMAVRHRTRPHLGLQFHPESILTPLGKQVIAAFLQTTGEAVFLR